jgi:large subunit ribosomal protein L15
MSKLLDLRSNKGARNKFKRVGRGNASGKGTYSGRGRNGQNQRTGGGTRPGFEGGQTPLYRKMPKLKGFNNINRINYQVVNVGKLETFANNEEIDITKLFEQNLISNKIQPVKILGDGEVSKKLTLKVDKVSASAKAKIEKAKGKVVELKLTTAAPEKPAKKEKPEPKAKTAKPVKKIK